MPSEMITLQLGQYGNQSKHKLTIIPECRFKHKFLESDS